jgi:hypothetical protein
MVANHSTTGPHVGSPALVKPTPESPQFILEPDSREASELLESLDDAMFTAIAGEAGVVAAARELWVAAVSALPVELVEESREQYMRFAVDVTQRFECDEVRDPARVLIAVEIIELLSKT